MPQTFGEHFKACRKRTGKSVRAICEELPGNTYRPYWITQLEAGKRLAPTSEGMLGALARALELQANSEEWYEFCDLAAAENGRIPGYLMGYKSVVDRLPTAETSPRCERRG